MGCAMKNGTSALPKVLAAYVVLLGVASLTAVRAEGGPGAVTPSAKSDSGAVADTFGAGQGDATVDRHAGDKGDNQGSSTGEQHGTNGVQGGDGADNSKAAGQGEDPGGFTRSELESSPIDTSNTIVSKPRWAKAWKTHDPKKFKVVRKRSGGPLRSFAHAQDHVLRNAIGLRIHAMRIGLKSGERTRWGKGGVDGRSLRPSFASNGGGDGAAGLHDRAYVPLAANGAIPRDAHLNGTMNSQIDGRDLIRASARPGAIGGATKTFAGVINGANFRPRHP
jgi:hypothetical protein